MRSFSWPRGLTAILSILIALMPLSLSASIAHAAKNTDASLKTTLTNAARATFIAGDAGRTIAAGAAPDV